MYMRMVLGVTRRALAATAVVTHPEASSMTSVSSPRTSLSSTRGILPTDPPTGHRPVPHQVERSLISEHPEIPHHFCGLGSWMCAAPSRTLSSNVFLQLRQLRSSMSPKLPFRVGN